MKRGLSFPLELLELPPQYGNTKIEFYPSGEFCSLPEVVRLVATGGW